MGSNDVVSIRVEALGVSITIVDGNIAIEQTRPEIRAARAAPKVEPAATSGSVPASKRQPSPASQEIPVRASPIAERAPSLANDVDNSSPGGNENPGEACGQVRNSLPPWLDEQPQPSPPHRSDQTKWNDEEVEKLKALYPTHSASAIAEQLGRRFNAVRGKARKLGLRKDGPPTVTSKPAKPAPQPRSLSAAVTTDPNDVFTRASKNTRAPWFQRRGTARSSSRAMSVDNL